MENLKSKIAVVTGASSGIGASVVRALLDANLIVVGLARRVERVNELKEKLPEDQQERLHAIKCDVSQANEVESVFTEITENYGPIYVLVTSAGCMRSGQLCTIPSQTVEEVLHTNIMGVVNCTRCAFTAMQSNQNVVSIDGSDGDGVDTGHNIIGHVILINSILGHNVPVIQGHKPSFNIYPATKYAITAINEIYRQEFNALGARIKVSSLSPGLVNTDLISPKIKDNCGGIILQPEDVARAVIFILSQPPHVQIYELIMKPMGDVI